MSGSADLENKLRPLTLWLEKHVNGHRFLWLMSLLCFLIAWNRGIALLYGLLALMLALIAISWIAPWWNLRQLKLQRQQSGIAVAGRKAKLIYQFEGNQNGYFLHLKEQIPAAENIPHFIAEAIPGEQLALEFNCPQRGVFDLPAAEIHSSWPFGFLQRKISLPCPPCQLEVQPKTFRIRQLTQPQASTPLPEGADSFLQRNAHSEFSGVRQYREGDSLKQVHWGASARQQQLIVREFHSFETPCWLVVIDAQQGSALGEAPDSSFEYALQIAASLLVYAQEQQLRMQLVIGCANPITLTLEPGARDISDLLSVLARVKDDGDLDYSSLVKQTLAQHGDDPVLITVRKQSQELALQHQGGHLDVVYNDASFVNPMARYPEGWSQTAEHTRRLDLHRLSNLAQVWQS